MSDVTDLNPAARVALDAWLTMKAERDALEARVQALETALREHNEGCQALCGIGDQEAVACGYRPYFENSGRRCPNCPTYDIIDFPAETDCGHGQIVETGCPVCEKRLGRVGVEIGEYEEVPMMEACPKCYGHHNIGNPCPSDRKEDRPTPPYPWCRQPSVCRGTCPLDPNCGE